jgi:hypothetical protein
MIRFEALAAPTPATEATGEGDRRPPAKTAAAAGGDGGDDGLPADVAVKRLGDEVRLIVESGIESFTLKLNPSGARALGASLTAAGGASFYRTRT